MSSIVFFIVVAGLVFPVLSLCPWIGKIFVSWDRSHTKSAGKLMAHGGSIVNGFFLAINNCSSTFVNTGIALCVSGGTDWFLLPFIRLLFRVSTESLCQWELSIKGVGFGVNLLSWLVSEG